MSLLDSVQAFFQRDIVYLLISGLFIFVGVVDIVAQTGPIGFVLGLILVWLGLSRLYGFYMGERIGETIAKRFG